MREVVINRCYGGFSLSLEAERLYFELKGYTPIFHNGKFPWDKRWYCEELPDFYSRDIERHDPTLVEVIKRLGKKADGDCAKLVIETVHGRYRIEEYDGMESLEEEGSYSGWR